MKTLNQIIETDIISLGKRFGYKKHKELANHYNQYTENDRMNGIRSYTGGSGHSYLINDYHWGKSAGKTKPNAKVEFHTKHLDSAINAHRTPEELTVHSGIKYDPREKMKKGMVHHPAYLSTSLNKEHAAQFAGGKREYLTGEHNRHFNVLSIKVPKGHPGAYVGHIQDFASEREFILPRGSKLRHIKTETEKHYRSQSGDIKHHDVIHTHHMEVV